MNCQICGGLTRPLMYDLFDDRYGAPGRHTVYRCDACGFGRTLPGLAPDEIGVFYAKHYPLSAATADSVRASVVVEPRWKTWLAGTDNIAHQYTQAGERVLDIGSASGVSLLEIQARGGEAYGVEPDPTAAKLARSLKLRVHTGFITDNPFPTTRFDLITASQVIEHEPDPQAFLAALGQRLAPGGQVILAFPNGNALYRRLFGRRWLHWHIPYHYNFFTRRSFSQLAATSGFTVVKLRTITPNLWTIIQLRMLAEQPREGMMGSVWAAQHAGGIGTGQPSLVVRVARQIALRAASALITVVNRLIDGLGMGESFLVVLEPTPARGSRQ
ncbi:class I SAM-dependent methyltransferase [Candidatus Berkelbacteria bacterium]|nr:class I SAM-dependent methyltransferase [Candidatus Berkelbacteria bacterium]